MPASAVADVNWLLSAVTQASAALIAIVGGLLVSRYVALHAEQQGARRRVADLARRETEAQSHLAASEQALDAYYVDELLDDEDVFEVIVDSGFDPALRDVLDAAQEEQEEDLNQALLVAKLADLSSDLRAAMSAIVPLVPKVKEHPDWATFRRDHELPVEHRHAWEWLYDRVCSEREDEVLEEERRAARKSSPFGGLGFDTIRMPALSYGNPQVRATERIAEGQRQIAFENSLTNRIDEARAGVRALHQEKRLATETLDATRQPEGFGLALQVLTVLAMLGIGFPVVLMSLGPMTLEPWLRWSVTSAFFLGVALLLRFLFVYAALLREGGRSSLPNTVLGLLGPER
ncbi:hypothetical protein [Actinotalea solisilvae]|uniref:hypothetical protein n=1 Tax=Actinotalea solisilvae TaxID=2072922 RepID=UPI0018F1E925|nr:hypothetical protein [Actinotalea solisilvae]